jgi:hypothetical protein
VIFSLLGKLWTKKYPSSRFNHLSTTSASINPSNNGISKFTCTLKGVSWPLDEDASPVGSRRRIYVKLSIISFLYRTRDSLRNILIGSSAPPYFFSPPMGYCRARCNKSGNGSIVLVVEPDYLPDSEVLAFSRVYTP